MLSAEGLAILSGAEMIPARNSHLPGAAPESRSVISHVTEKYSVATANISDRYEGTDATHYRNMFPIDTAIVDGGNQVPRGGLDNVWLTRKPYVGQNGSIYVMLLDDAGEMSGAPIEVNLSTDGETHMTQAQIDAAKAAMDAAYDIYFIDHSTDAEKATYAAAKTTAVTDTGTYITARDAYIAAHVPGTDDVTFMNAATAFATAIDTTLGAAITAYETAGNSARITYLGETERYNQLRTLVEYLTEAKNLLTTYGAQAAQLTAIDTLLTNETTARDNAKISMDNARIDMAAKKADYDSKYRIYMEGNAGTQMIYLRKFKPGDTFVAFDATGNPINTADEPDPVTRDDMAIFDDKVEYYVDYTSALNNWVTGWGDIANFTRTIPEAAGYGAYWGDPGVAKHPYTYLLRPSGGVAQPKCFKEGSQFVYKLNVPSILYQDIVLLDYYVEYRHNATQVSILPDKFAPFMYVEGSSLVRRASDGIDLPVEFVIPKLKITTALTFTLQSTGDASTFNFQGDALTMDSAA